MDATQKSPLSLQTGQGRSERPQSHKGKKAVVFHQGALGDFIVAAAAVDELAQTAGFTCVDFWSRPEHISLLGAKNYLGRCWPCDSPLVAQLLHDSLWRTALLPDFLIHADRIFIFGQTGSRLIARRLSLRLATDVNWIQSFPTEKDVPRRVSDFLRTQFADLGLPITGRPLALHPPGAEKKAAQELLSRLGIGLTPVLLHPGSGGRRKVWPLENWRGLIDWVRRKLARQVVLSIGPADEYLDQFSLEMRKIGVPVISGLPLLNLAALLALCGLYIGSDSGVSHLAAAVGVPTIAVFGPTDPRVWAPRGGHVLAVRRNWREEQILAWDPSAPPSFEDREIADFVKNCCLCPV